MAVDKNGNKLNIYQYTNEYFLVMDIPSLRNVLSITHDEIEDNRKVFKLIREAELSSDEPDEELVKEWARIVVKDEIFVKRVQNRIEELTREV